MDLEPLGGLHPDLQQLPNGYKVETLSSVPDPFRLIWRRLIRLIPLRMAPPGGQGVDQVIHNGPYIEMTIPWDIEHRFRSLIRHAAEAVICTLEFGATTGLIPALASPLATLGIRALRQYQQTLDNKDLLNIAGIDYNDTLSGQRIESFYQLEAMRVLFPNLPWRPGVADALTLDQYNDLTMMTNGMPIILNNSCSVATFTDALSRLSRVDTIPLTIESAYFQGRADGSQGRSNADMMNKLGLALRDRKELKHLSIHVTAVDDHGILEDRIFAGLRAVLGSRSLETLRISGMPSFLEDEHIKIRCRRLRDLDLVGVKVNTYLAVKNINKVHKCAKDARIMSSHSSPSTPSAI